MYQAIRDKIRAKKHVTDIAAQHPRQISAAVNAHDMDVDAFIEQQLKLLVLERDAEVEEGKRLRAGTDAFWRSDLQETLPEKELQRRGLCLVKLRVAGCHTGLAGRALLKLRHKETDTPLP